jgi:peptidoglycan/xylan/chitin deacetylase (PgdA/CDA1 family)
MWVSGYDTNRERIDSRRPIRVFRYHGVVERLREPLLEWRFTPLEVFRSHLRLFRIAPVLSLEEIDAVLSGRSRAPRGAAAITFDDGYRNNLAALELLAVLRKPAAVFVAAGPVSRQMPVWTAEVPLLLLHGAAARVEALGESFPLATRQDRERALDNLSRKLKRLPARDRRQAVDGMREQFPRGESQRLLHAFPSLQMMGWGEVRQVCGSGFAIGSRGVEREIHHAEQDLVARRSEFCLSRLRIERETGRLCRYFAYPNGACHADSRREAERAGYAMAFSSHPAAVTRKNDRFMLPRLTPAGPLRSLLSEYVLARGNAKRFGSE